jgi:hypothetical protein
MRLRLTGAGAGALLLVVCALAYGVSRLVGVLTEDELTKAMRELEALGFTPKHILDVGANEGNWGDEMQARVPGADFFHIEGNVALEHFLKDKGRPYRIAIVGDEEKPVTFFKLCDGGLCSGGSSVFVENTKFGPGMIKEERQMTTIDKLVSDARADGTCSVQYICNIYMGITMQILHTNIPCVLSGAGTLSHDHQFDLLKIDVQGAEKIALTGAKDTLQSVQVILAETSNVEYNKGAPGTTEMLTFFESLGFQIFDIIELHRKRLHGHGHGILFQMDFLLVRKGSPILDAAHQYWVNGGR